MNILIIGSNGRSHALVWKLAQSPLVSKIFVAPGNFGTSSEPKVKNIDIQFTDIPRLIDFARKNHVNLVAVPQESSFAVGVVDAFKKVGIPIFGPTKAAAEIETSKSFCKEFLSRHGIPCPKFETFTDPELAKKYIKEEGVPIVVKADGLANSIGVVVAHDFDTAFAAVDRLLSNEIPSSIRKIEIEEFVEGDEVNYIVMFDGQNIVPFSSVGEHKTLLNDDKGPLTGGMGAFSPHAIMTPELDLKIMKKIIMPTVKALKAEKRTYQGFLYAGLMILPNGEPTVLEYNCRLGDPMCQTLMMRLDDDLCRLLIATVEKRLGEVNTTWDPRPAVTVVMTSEGYPNKTAIDEVITGLPTTSIRELKVFHAGTRKNENGEVITTDGRVITVGALGDNIADAKNRAYNLAKNIKWKSQYYRTDIAKKAAERKE